MWILCLALLYTAATRVQGYGSSWHDLPASQAPPFQRPVDVMTDVINDLGVRILQQYGETGRYGNVAFSPTGIGFVLAALYEGSAGPGHEQIVHALDLPQEKDITRIGLRDIHRRLRSYLSPDGFLGGLTLNRDNTKLRPEYENVLKFLGFDVASRANGSTENSTSTTLPETMAEAPTTPSDPSSLPATTPITVDVSETTESSTIITTLVGEDFGEASTSSSNMPTTIIASTEELTTATSDVDTTTITITTETIPAPTITVSEMVDNSGEELTTISSTLPIPTTTELLTTTLQASSALTEALIDETTELVSLTTMSVTVDTPVMVTKDATTEVVMQTTLASVEEVTDTTTLGSTTVNTEATIPGESTTPMVPEVGVVTESTSTVTIDLEEDGSESESESDVTISSSEETIEESLEELATTTAMEERTTPQPEEMVSNEIVSESTTSRIDTTTILPDAEVDTLLDSMSSETETLLLTSERKNGSAEITTTSSSLELESRERRRVRGVGIRDPVVRTLLNARSAEPEVKVAARSDLVNSKEIGAVWINRIVEYSFTEKNADRSTNLLTVPEQGGDHQNEKSVSWSASGEAVLEGDTLKRGTRSPRSYFPGHFNIPKFPSFPVYPDSPGASEETSWTRKVGGWRVHSSKLDEVSEDSSELTFLVNGEEPTVVSAATYTVVLPFAFLPSLQVLALEFPLDDPRYNILLLLPTDRDGTRRLAKELESVGLRELRKELHPAWVRAIIPSFMLKGFVTLTSFLQRIGIRDVFEPRDADLSPMTDDVGVYARDVQQSIGVNIRNYMKPDRTHSRNGLFERAGPVSFVAEHPFLFFIIDAETGVSLIAGRIEDPANSRIL